VTRSRSSTPRPASQSPTFRQSSPGNNTAVAIRNISLSRPTRRPSFPPTLLLADNSIWQQRLSGLVTGLFAGLALLLATVGIYGLLSYSVSQRAREIGMRVALGARPRQILSTILGQGARLTLIGAVIGLLVAFGVTRMMSTLLYRVSVSDPTAFLFVTLILAGISMTACFVPARRATHVDPAITLRME
jgi:putative ABC transport system permease protein